MFARLHHFCHSVTCLPGCTLERMLHMFTPQLAMLLSACRCLWMWICGWVGRGIVCGDLCYQLEAL